jgi:hypothetical protein
MSGKEQRPVPTVVFARCFTKLEVEGVEDGSVIADTTVQKLKEILQVH